MGWNNGIAMKTGVNYSSINEIYLYRSQFHYQIKTITIIKYIYDDQLVAIDSIKTTENVSHSGNKYRYQYNKISLVDIRCSYNTPYLAKEDCHTILVCGPSSTLSLVQSGKILNSSSNELVNLQDQNIYKNNIGLSFYGGIGINYRIDEEIFKYPLTQCKDYTSSVSVTHLSIKILGSQLVTAAFRYKIF